MIRAAIFDMDGLLIDSEPFWREAEKAAFLQVGMELSDADCRLTMGQSTREVVAFWYNENPWKGMSRAELERLILSEVSTAIMEKGKAMPGVTDALELISRKGLKIGLASSSPQHLIEIVTEKLGIGKYFDVMHSAEYELAGKPDPVVFISTAEKLCVKVEECVVFEDSLFGVIAAKKAGMHVVAIPEQDTRNNEMVRLADIMLPSLNCFDESVLKLLDADSSS